MNIQTISFIIILSITLYIVGLWMNKKALFLSMSGAIILMILGILMFNNPLEERIGQNITEIDATHTTTTYTYQNINTFLNQAMSTTFIILGLVGTLIPITLYRKSQFSESDN